MGKKGYHLIFQSYKKSDAEHYLKRGKEQDQNTYMKQRKLPMTTKEKTYKGKTWNYDVPAKKGDKTTNRKTLYEVWAPHYGEKRRR